jgi:GMP synthase (glutamine-hydrolysing)
MIIILDLGGGLSQPVARKVRGEKVYCEVLPFDTPIETLSLKKPKGLILVGGGDSLIAGSEHAGRTAIYDFNIPVLAIGSASRAMAVHMGGRPLGAVIERHTLEVSFGQSPLFNGLTASERYINRMDAIELPEGFSVIATGGGLTAAFADEGRKLYAMQFSAEQNDPDGLKILSNFTRLICQCDPWWSMETFAHQQVEAIRERIGGSGAIMAISGGVDSSVCAALMHRAIGRRMHCLYVDTGLMRKDETLFIKRAFDTQMGMDLIVIDARERYLERLKGIVDPEAKRRAVGEEFVRVFEEEAAKIGDVEYLVQGTIYSDVIESIGVEGKMIKTHHNVGGLPDVIQFKSIVEPLRELFKDEVRQVGEVLEMPREIIYRQPFPGPGLSVRCLGEVTEEKLGILREADAIFSEEIVAAGLDKRIWQYFAVLTDMRSTGVRDDNRAYDRVIALRAVNSIDAMSASAYRMPYDLLERVSNRVANEVPGAGRVVYDVTGKPPGTIEWE